VGEGQGRLSLYEIKAKKVKYFFELLKEDLQQKEAFFISDQQGACSKQAPC
jgi:hypothetical protein